MSDMRPDHFFSSEDVRRVNEAIASAEQATSGEIVPVVVSQSSDYKEATYLGGIIGSILVYFITIYFRHIDKPSRVLVTLAIGYLIGILLSQVPSIRRVLIGHSFSEKEVWKRAALEFQINQIGKTAAQTGILILVSLIERVVIVYGDKPIAEKIPQADWEDVRDRILDGLRRKRPADGLVAGIARCGEILAGHFPRQSDDVNELPDQLILKV